MPHTEQKRCFAVPVLKVYVVSTSLPERSLKRSARTMRCRYPALLHIEQLHSETSALAGASASNLTRPQWQPPRCVTSGCSDMSRQLLFVMAAALSSTRRTIAQCFRDRPVLSNVFHEEVGIDRAQRGGGIELGDLCGAERDRCRLEIILQLTQLRRADDDAGHRLTCEQPRDRDLRDTGVMGGGDGAHPLHEPEALFLVEGKDVEAGEAIVGIRQRLPGIFPAEEARGERAPDGEAESVAPHHRDDVALDVAAHQ